jgi:hypothetical protein
MEKQLLVNTVLAQLPVSHSGIIYISAITGGSLSKTKYYVN